MSQQPIIEHLLFVVRILEDRRIVGPDRFYYTVSKDAVRIYTSPMMTEDQAVAAASGKWSTHNDQALRPAGKETL